MKLKHCIGYTGHVCLAEFQAKTRQVRCRSCQDEHNKLNQKKWHGTHYTPSTTPRSRKRAEFTREKRRNAFSAGALMHMSAEQFIVAVSRIVRGEAQMVRSA